MRHQGPHHLATLSRLWHDMLPNARVMGSGADFHTAGGDSLYAIKLESLPVSSKAVNACDVNTEVLDLMRLVAKLHEGYVRTILTRND